MSNKEEFRVTVTKRTALGTSSSRRLRRAGFVPGIVYGHGQEPRCLQLAEVDMRRLEHHGGLVYLDDEAGGDAVLAIVKDVQRNYLQRDVLHVDFLEVRADEQVSADVRIEPTGEAVGLSHGGMLDQMMHQIEVTCLPTELPEAVFVDVSGLNVDDILYVSEIAMPEGVSVSSTVDPESAVFAVRLSRMEEAEEAEEALEPGEVPEVGEEEEEEQDGDEA
jgi:large subunit ribosomal protein L25